MGTAPAKRILAILDEDDSGVQQIPSAVDRSMEADNDKCDNSGGSTHYMIKVGFRELQEMFQIAKVDVSTQRELYLALEQRRKESIRKEGSHDWLNLERRKTWRRELLRKSNFLSEKIHYSGSIMKISRRQNRHERALVITNRALYFLVSDSHECRRRIPLDKVSCVTKSTITKERVIHLLCNFEIIFRFAENDEEGLLPALKDAYKNLLGLELAIQSLKSTSLHSLTTYKTTRRRSATSSHARLSKSLISSASSINLSECGENNDNHRNSRSASLSVAAGASANLGSQLSIELKVGEAKLRRGSHVSTGSGRKSFSSLCDGGSHHDPVIVAPGVLRRLLENVYGEGTFRNVSAGYVRVEGLYTIGCIAVAGRKRMDETEIWISKNLQRRIAAMPGGLVTISLLDLRRFPSTEVFPFDEIVSKHIEDMQKQRASLTKRLNKKESCRRDSGMSSRSFDATNEAAMEAPTPKSTVERDLLPLLVNTKVARLRHWARWINPSEILKQAFATSNPGFDPRAAGAFQPNTASEMHQSQRQVGHLSLIKSKLQVLPALDLIKGRVRIAYLTFDGKNSSRNLNMTKFINENTVQDYRYKKCNETRFSPLSSWAADACHEKQYNCRMRLRGRIKNYLPNKDNKIIGIVEAYLGHLGAHFLAEAEGCVSEIDQDVVATLVRVPDPGWCPRWENRSWLPLEFYSFLWQQDVLVISLEDGDLSRHHSRRQWKNWISRISKCRLCKGLIILVRGDVISFASPRNIKSSSNGTPPDSKESTPTSNSPLHSFKFSSPPWTPSKHCNISNSPQGAMESPHYLFSPPTENVISSSFSSSSRPASPPSQHTGSISPKRPRTTQALSAPEPYRSRDYYNDDSRTLKVIKTICSPYGIQVELVRAQNGGCNSPQKSKTLNNKDNAKHNSEGGERKRKGFNLDLTDENNENMQFWEAVERITRSLQILI
eukprot:jgi/Bigna1/69585/fgenesh1_pg.9_\